MSFPAFRLLPGLLASLALLASGCQLTGPLRAPDPTLADVNEAMAGETVRLHRAGSSGYEKVSQVSLSADSVYYVPGMIRPYESYDGPVRQMPIEAIDSLQVKFNGGGGVVGGLVGAAPGIFTTADAYSTSRNCESISCGLSSGIAQSMGIALTFVGLGLGALIGNAVDVDVQTVYRRPIDPYLR
ncbi:hypothetical protein [Longibacter sp.]|uniref:hypothetical protein n=1 Tax=Longibacter sp. TaxID=2045415 RepID=UPI003EBB36C6